MLKINSHNYNERLIYEKLQHAYESAYSLPSTHAKLYLGDPANYRACLRETEIKYYIKNFDILERQFEASECRINLNNDYQAIISPTINYESFLPETIDPVSKHLENKFIEKLDHFQIPFLNKIDFYSFYDLNYDLQCLIDYQEIGQVKFNQKFLRVSMEEIYEIPDSCGFQNIDKEFTGKFNELVQIDIPINGTFYCKNGRSSTCKKAAAEYNNPRYKLFRES